MPGAVGRLVRALLEALAAARPARLIHGRKGTYRGRLVYLF